MRRKKNQILPIVVFVLLFVGVIYAILQTNLQINGTTKIANNTWDVHFANIVVNQNSVAIGTGDSAATIDSNNPLKVDFEVTLSLPGDFYEFTVDVVNAGTIDAMIGSIEKTLKVNNVLTETVPSYLNYAVTNEDGTEIVNNQLLVKNTSTKIKVKIEYRTDIDELPDASTLSMSLEPVYIQADSTAIELDTLFDVFRLEADSGSGQVQKYTGSHKDSFTERGTRSIFYFYGGGSTPSEEETIAAEILDKWNVLFAGFCWQMYRTTDTGGVKLLYNGLPNNGKCSSTNPESYILENSIFNSMPSPGSFGMGASPSLSGFMINSNFVVYSDSFDYERTSSGREEGWLFGESFSYSDADNGYRLINTTTTYDSTHHYTCEEGVAICNDVRYYFMDDYYIYVNSQETVGDMLVDVLSDDDVNLNNSEIKNTIFYWYTDNLSDYTSLLEDTIFCNDRSVIDYGGWNPNGGSIHSPLVFKNGVFNTNLSCQNVTDQFSLTNQVAEIGDPIGLMTAPEANLLGSSSLRKSSSSFWLMSPHSYSDADTYMNYVDTNGQILPGKVAYYDDDYHSVRPVVSLKSGTKIISGDGSQNSPYVVG